MSGLQVDELAQEAPIMLAAAKTAVGHFGQFAKELRIISDHTPYFSVSNCGQFLGITSAIWSESGSRGVSFRRSHGNVHKASG